MRIALLVLGSVMAASGIAAWSSARLDEKRRDRVALASAFVLRLAMGTLFSLLAIAGAARGGYGWIMVGVSTPLAVVSLGFAGLIAWVWVTGKSDGE